MRYSRDAKSPWWHGLRKPPLQVADPKRLLVFGSLLVEFDLPRVRRLGASIG
jgi:hypothetical protein